MLLFRPLGTALRRGVRTLSVRQLGVPQTNNYAAYLQDNNGKVVSPFHDIPLATSTHGVYNMVVEVPRWTNAKLEISKQLELNPIVQDVKKDKLRYVANIFPFKGYMHNYGALPQTWEDPQHKDNDTGYFGDKDPLDVCEIGSQVSYTGEVKKVKILGCLAMLDEGETDWKLIAIDVNDQLADRMQDIHDVEVFMPGFLNSTKIWFRDYKVPDGKPKNEFAFGGEYKDREYALGIVERCYDSWKGLLEGKLQDPEINTTNTTLKHTAAHDPKASDRVGHGVVIDGKEHVDMEKWHYISDIV